MRLPVFKAVIEPRNGSSLSYNAKKLVLIKVYLFFLNKQLALIDIIRKKIRTKQYKLLLNMLSNTKIKCKNLGTVWQAIKEIKSEVLD